METKIREVIFSNTYTEHLYGFTQYDRGQKLKIKGIDGIDTDANIEVHFSLSASGGDAPRVIPEIVGTEIIVSIPDFVFSANESNDYEAYAFVCYSDINFGKTECRIIMHVKSRPKPADFAPPSKPDLAQKVLQELSTKLTAPQTAQVGQIFEVKEVNEDGTLTLEAVDMPSGGVVDVTVDGKSILDEDGVADIPIAGDSILGAVSVRGDYGVNVNQENGLLYTEIAGETNIDERKGRKVISPMNVDYAVKAAMCDGKGLEWTEEEQSAARSRMGVGNYVAGYVSLVIDRAKTFVAEYGVTPFSDISNAISEEKNVIVKYTGIVGGIRGVIYGELNSYTSGITATFNAIAYNKSYEFICDRASGWLVTEKDLATKKYVDDGLLMKLTAPQTAKVGQIFRVQEVNADGTLTLEAVDMPSGGAVYDVQIGGTSIVSEDGVADIPIATQKKPGVIQYSSMYGMQNVGGTLAPLGWTTYVTNRQNAFLSASSTDLIVRAAMCDGIGEAWTADEQAAARTRMGVGDWELIEEITLTETANVTRTTTPDGKTYADCNFKDFIICIHNSSDVGSKYAYIYRIQDDVEHTAATALNVNAGENGIVYTRLITDGISEYGYYKTSSDGYIQPSRQGACLFSGCINRIIISGCTSGTIIKIYGVRA